MKADEELEFTLIGEILAKPEIMAECAQYLTPKSFANLNARRVYDECLKLFTQGKTIDPLTVVSAMGNEKDEYKVFMLDCYRLVISMSAYASHIRLIRENSIKREVQSECFDIVSGAENLTLDEIQEKLSRVLRLFDKVNDRSVKTVPEMHRELLEYLYSDDEYIKTGFPILDKTLLISKGDYIIVGGRPSTGKTALTAQFALNMAKKHNVVYFSLETTALKLWTRMVSNGGRVKLYDIKTKAIISSCYPNSTKTWENINSFAIEMAENARLTVLSEKSFTVNQIRSAALQLKADVIIIDYLTLINDSGKTAYEKATRISTDLHILAQSENMTVIAIAQLNRASLANDEPSMADIRESGQIEQDADAILLLSNKRDIDIGEYAERKLYIAKNKEGVTGKIDMIFKGDYLHFQEKQPD